LPAQLGHPLAQLRERHQAFLISRDQALPALFQPCLFSTQLFVSFAERISVSSYLPVSINLRLDGHRI
jgi:hypothetical protein